MNKTLAYGLSVLGHPLLVITYVLLVMLSVNPYQFGARNMFEPRAFIVLFSVFSTSFLIPAVGIALMKPLGLIKSMDMEDKQERIGPYIVAGIFYLWLFKNLLSSGQSPKLFTQFVLGATIALFLSFFINIFTKISAHAAGMGGLVTMLAIMAFSWGGVAMGISINQGTLLISLLLVFLFGVVLAGSVGTARLALGAHTPVDLYRGYAIGVIAVLLAQLL